MTNQFLFSRVVRATAMSKRVHQAGMYIEDLDNNNIGLNSVNQKDGQVTSYLELQVPKEDIPKLIESLKGFL